MLIALAAQVAIPIAFSPVPITGQTLGVLLVGALLGSKRGSLAVLAYLAEGLAGWPVFAAGGAGPSRLLGPTGGYLLGFVAAAYVTGWLAERGWGRRAGYAFAAMLAGNALIYVFGLLWLRRYIGDERLLTAGFYPFVVGDLLKAALAAGLLPAGWRLLRRVR